MINKQIINDNKRTRVLTLQVFVRKTRKPKSSRAPAPPPLPRWAWAVGVSRRSRVRRPPKSLRDLQPRNILALGMRACASTSLLLLNRSGYRTLLTFWH